VVRTVIAALQHERLLDAVSHLVDRFRDEADRWEPVEIPPQVRRMYASAGPRAADGSQPVRFGSGPSLRG